MDDCAGDSGLPVFQTLTDGAKVIGVVRWVAGPNKTKELRRHTGRNFTVALSPMDRRNSMSKLGGTSGTLSAPI